MIIRNAARCNKCGDVIQSTHRHDFVRCSCSAIFVDGGHEYLRAGGDGEDIEFLYISTDKPYVPESVQLEHSDIILAAHHSSTCVGQICALHKRTDHEMRGWEQSLEMVGRVFVITRICPHDFAHTDPDDFYVHDLDWCNICKPKHKTVVELKLRKEIEHIESCPCNNADERGCFLISAKTNKCVSCECDNNE